MEIINNTPFEAEAIPYKGPEDDAFVTLVVKGTYAIEGPNRITIADTQRPIAFGDEPHDPDNGGSTKFEADIAPFKPRADIVLVGQAHAPPGRAVAAMDVSLRVGVMHRVLRVFGDRTWKCPTMGSVQASAPQPYERMPLVYERAFGGLDTNSGGFCHQNLAGRGFFAKPTRKSVDRQPLPNVESPQALIKSPKDHPQPAGFGFYGRAWQPRVSFLGTYDEKWRKTRSPDLPTDFKYNYCNAAHPDLQYDGYLVGEEAVELRNLSGSHSVLGFQLPATNLRVRAKKSYDALAAYLEEKPDADNTPAAPTFPEPSEDNVALNLDTLCLLPDEDAFFLLWRGRIPVHDLTALEVQTIEIS